MNKKELIEIIEGCVINSQVLINENVCFNELRKELNEEIPEQLTLTDVVSTSCDKCDNTGVLWSKDRLSAKTCSCK
jgi:hypothetical protein